MNINAINQMMMNKNLKFGANEVPQEPQKPMGNTPEGPVTKPGEGLNALANNNIAFQGLNLTKVADKMGPAARKTLLPLLGAAMLAPAAVSCTKEPILIERPPVNVEVNTTVNVDLDALTELLKLLIDQNKLTKDQMDAINERLDKVIAELEKGNDRDAAFQEQAYNLALQILEQLIANNEELAYLRADVEAIKNIAENGDYLIALKEIQEILNGIKDEVGDINLTLKEGLNKLFEYMQNSDEEFMNEMREWKEQYNNNELSQAKYQEKMLELIVANFDKLLGNLEQFMTRDEAKAYLEKIVSQLGDINASIENKLNMLLAYMQGSDEKFLNEMREWKEQYDNNELSQAKYQEKMLELINTNFDKLLNGLEKFMSKDEAKAYLEKIVSELGRVNESLDFITELLIQQAEEAIDNAELEEARFNALVALLKAIKEDTASIDSILKGMEGKLDKANESLYKLGLNIEKVEDAINNIVIENGEGITLEDLKAILGEQSDAWKAFIELQFALHLEGVKDESSKVLDVLGEMNDKMVTKKMFNDQMNRLYDLLNALKAQGREITQEMKDLIAGLDFSCNCEHNCNCGNDKVEENEGILGDLDNLVNGNN